MNRYSTINYILMMKDQGCKEIFVIVDGKRYQVPTKFSGEGSYPLANIMAADGEAAVHIPELKII